MSGEWDGLRAAAEAAPEQTVTDVTVTGVWLSGRHHLTVPPAIVLEILDRLQAAEAVVERVRRVAAAGDVRTLDDDAAPCVMLDDLAAALESPQEPTGADLSASGAESDHGGRRDGEGLA